MNTQNGKLQFSAKRLKFWAGYRTEGGAKIENGKKMTNGKLSAAINGTDHFAVGPEK